MSAAPPQPVPRWLHAWAVLTAVVAAAAVTMGAVVTTFRVGMADPVWPTYPWHLLLISWDEPSPGYVVEHTHRLAAYGAGFCVIVLAVGLWAAGSRRLALAALACVVLQGLLGGARVLLNAPAGPELAAVHGVCAQLVFALLVCLATLTAPRRFEEFSSPDYARRCRRAATVLTGLAVVQLVLGAVVRHLHDPTALRLHVLNAFAVTAAVVWVRLTGWERADGRRVLGRPLGVITVLLAVQLLLGVETLLSQLASDLPPEARPVQVGSAVRTTSHVVVGALLLAAAATMAVRAYRASAAVPAVGPRPAADSEGVYAGVPAGQQIRGVV